jgi:pantetheine-phosphate adenylyltransferase
MEQAIYAGSFDPVTNGHLDVIERGCRLFHRLVVAVATNIGKSPLFTPDERVDMIRRAIDLVAAPGDGRFQNVEVCAFDGLVVELARARRIRCLLRGVRTFSDFEVELQMALTNRDLAPEIETVFVMPSLQHSYVSSRLIRETVKLGADVTHLIPAFVQDRLRQRLTQEERP